VEAQGRLEPGPPRWRRPLRIGAAEQSSQEVPAVLLRSDREERLAHHAGSLTPLVAPRRAGHVDFQAAPAEWPPQQRFHLADRLNPAVGDGLGNGLQQPALNADPFGASTAMKAYWPESRRQMTRRH